MEILPMVEKQLNKEKANANMYYNLFADKIGNFNNNENVLLIHIGNFDVISKFIVNNVNCNYFIIDQHLNGNYLKLNFPQIHFFGSKEDENIIEVLEQLDMKFDKIIMNPPYNKNLHLKILAEAIKHLNEDGECVNLSPIRWLQDPSAKYKKSSDYKKYEPILKKLRYLTVIDAVFAAKIFKAEMIMDLGIYHFNQMGGFDYFNFISDKIIDKVLPKMNLFLENVVEENKLDGIRVRVSKIRPVPSNRPNNKNGRNNFLFGTTHEFLSWVYENGYTKDGIFWTENKLPGAGGPKTYDVGDPLPYSIKFNDIKSANNFEQSVRTDFYHYLILKLKTDQNYPMRFAPWMGDCIHPRTGLKGYESEWTNEDFYTYFNITKEEQELIEKTMEKYK
jgi:hypothetical protein